MDTYQLQELLDENKEKIPDNLYLQISNMLMDKFKNNLNGTGRTQNRLQRAYRARLDRIQWRLNTTRRREQSIRDRERNLREWEQNKLNRIQVKLNRSEVKLDDVQKKLYKALGDIKGYKIALNLVIFIVFVDTLIRYSREK